MTTSALAFIIATPTPLRYSLRALLTRLSQINEVREVDDVRSFLPALPAAKPRLIVLDANVLQGEAEQMLQEIKAAVPEARLVVLVDHIAQQQAVKATIADRVLLQGYPAADLYANLEQLLTQSEQSDDQR
jgi:DNA-binding NarL/FixJ family response regulator